MAAKIVLGLIGLLAGAVMAGYGNEPTKNTAAVCFTLTIVALAVLGELGTLRRAIADARATPEELAEALKAAARKTKATSDGPPPVPAK